MDQATPKPDLGLMMRVLYEKSCEHAFIFQAPDGTILHWSPGAEQVFGWTEAQAVGENCTLFFTPEDVAMGIHEQERRIALADGAAEDDRWSMRADGQRFFANGALIALHHEGRHVGFAKIVRNRTDIREQIERLKNEQVQDEARAKRIDAFLSTLSHELRNPLAPLDAAVRILRRAGPAGEEAEYALRVIERQMDLMQRLVNDLMDISRVSMGKVLLERRRVELCGLVRAAVDDSRTVMEKRSHRLQLLLPAGEILVDADPDRLLQVFGNLLTNAAKYTPPGGQVWVKVTTEADEAVVRVEDAGVGIPPEMLPRIFDLFTQVESSRAQSQGGLGVGLALVKNLVELHGGSVQAKSDGIGKGSEFTVRLPLVRTEPADSPANG
jgi:two-component system CheB/CheR fusion protein